MRNIIKNIKSKLFKKMWKKIIGLVILIWLWSIVFSSNSNVYAQTSTPAGTETTTTVEEEQDVMIMNFNKTSSSLLKFIYWLLWPVLFICGIALDNTLVYWWFLHLDASLWSLWNIMKNFANFALWFMVLFAIVRNIFAAPFGKSWDKWSPVNIIKKTLIAGVLIQMSWFLMAAVIDLSTILTYSVWWLPMTVLQNNPDYSEKTIFWISAILDINDNNDNNMWLNYHNTYAWKRVSPCIVKEVNWLTWDYIWGREMVIFDEDTIFQDNICAIWAWPYKFKEHFITEDNPISSYSDNVWYREGFDSYMNDISSDDARWLVADCSLISTDYSEIPKTCLDAWYWVLWSKDSFFTDVDDDQKMTVDSLLEKSKGFVWPFITIYSSLLDFTTIVEDPNQNAWNMSTFFVLVIKLLFAVALFFPLLALAAVLIARVWIIWLAIAISPILVLLWVFKGVFDIGGKSGSGLFEHFSGSNLVKLIFAPVFVVFAISMSLIFLTALTDRGVGNYDTENVDAKITNKEWQMEELGMYKVSDRTYSILGLIEIELDWEKVDKGMDTFARLITNLFAVWIIWFFLFFAVKMTKLWEKLWWWIQDTVQNLMKNLPIIPIAWGVGISAAGEGIRGLKWKITTPMYEKQMKELRKEMPWLYGPWGEESTANQNNSKATEQDAWINYMKAQSLYAGGWYSTMDAALQEAGVTSEQRDIISNIDSTYLDNNTFVSYSQTLGGKWSEEENITTYSAENMAVADIQNRVNSWWAWWEWAKWVLGGNVKTADGNTYVMVNKWTHADPDFKLVDQDTYAKEYLWQTEDWTFDTEKAKTDIEDRIKKRYNLWDNATADELAEQQKHIDAEQKEIADRIALLESQKNTTAIPDANPSPDKSVDVDWDSEKTD